MSQKQTDNDIFIVNQKCAHTLSFYRAATGEELSSIRLPDYPHEFVVDNQARYLFVGHYGILGSDCIGDPGGCSVFVIDIEQRAHVHTLSTWPHYRIHGLGIDKFNRLYAMSEADNVLLRFSDPLKQTMPDLAVPSGGIKTHLFALTSDGEFAFSVNLLSNTVCKIKPNDATFAPQAIATGRKPEGNCLSLDEQTLYITNRDDNTIVAIDCETMTIKATADTGKDPNRVYRAPDGHLLVINYGDQFVSKFDAKLNEVARIALEYVPVAISFHPNNQYAYLSLQGDRIGVVDLRADKIMRYFASRQEPDVSFLLAGK
ncbi:MAG: YncE family protein [Ostreibacterium sp.]